jgi:hypothetical protein
VRKDSKSGIQVVDRARIGLPQTYAKNLLLTDFSFSVSGTEKLPRVLRAGLTKLKK